LTPEDLVLNSSDNCAVYLSLSQDTFTTPGPYTIVVTAADGNGNLTQCSTNIKVMEPFPFEFGCRRDEIVLQLDATGNAVLKTEDICIGSLVNTSFNLSKTNFNCSNLGINTIAIILTGEIEGTCTVQVSVKDEIAPVVRTKNISMFLNSSGVVNITPELINDGSTDNCGGLTYSIDSNTLRCKDL